MSQLRPNITLMTLYRGLGVSNKVRLLLVTGAILDGCPFCRHHRLIWYQWELNQSHLNHQATAPKTVNKNQK